MHQPIKILHKKTINCEFDCETPNTTFLSVAIPKAKCGCEGDGLEMGMDASFLCQEILNTSCQEFSVASLCNALMDWASKTNTLLIENNIDASPFITTPTPYVYTVSDNWRSATSSSQYCFWGDDPHWGDPSNKHQTGCYNSKELNFYCDLHTTLPNRLNCYDIDLQTPFKCCYHKKCNHWHCRPCADFDPIPVIPPPIRMSPPLEWPESCFARGMDFSNPELLFDIALDLY